MNLAILIASVCSLIGPNTSAKIPVPLAGDYVEARTASVFAGPCHYNGELVTTGCDAVMAWQFNSGSWNHVDLSGVRVMAVVTSDQNLGQTAGSRKSAIIIDDSASAQQANAAVHAILSHDGQSLGHVVTIQRGVVSFRHYAREFHVTAAGFGAMDVKGMPNDECCKQPNLVWYSPLVHLTWRKVGYTINAAYVAGQISDPWQRSDENSAFYGEFSY
ncbi:MAG TPA: DUF1326 domain-containing protein [Tepidisphaeraceae bacterium]|jgi:hypothetical protein|nr:DUF1326 domain-containing protein [Tepidisphaeraceae bacterium]